MPKDRLNEFKSASTQNGMAEDVEAEVTIRTPFKIQLTKKSSKTTAKQLDEGGDKALDTFLKDIEWLADNIGNLDSRVRDVKQTQSSILSCPHTNDELKERLEGQNNGMRKLSQTIQKELKVIEGRVKNEERENDEKERAGERKEHWADLRIKKAQYRAMMQRFTNAMMAYNDVQLNYREQCKKRIQKSLQIANREMTEEEVEKMIESEDPQIFSEQYCILAKQAKLDLQELEARHNELVQLECSLQELKELFFQVAVLVDAQGEVVDRIEMQVNEAREYVEESVKHTHQAVVSKKKAYKRKVCLISCAGISLLILVILIVLAIWLG